MKIEDFYELYMPTIPRPHQAEEFRLYKDRGSRACLWTMRTGKSKAMIDLACYLFKENKIKTVLVIAPNGVHYNWIEREIPTHRWRDTPFNSYTWRSSNPNSIGDIERLAEDKDPFFLAINKESIMLDRMLNFIQKKLFRRGPAMLIVDESHHFRTPGAKQTKRLRALVKYFKVVRILTGSSVDNSPFAAYSQFELLGKATLGYSTFSDFKSVYGKFDMTVQGGRFTQKVVGYQNLEILRRDIERVSSIVGAEGLSGYEQTTEFFEMTPKQVIAYDTIKKDLLLSLDSGLELKSPEAGVKLIKLQQISSGFIIDEFKDIHELVSPEKNPRILKLLEILGDIEDKVIIWCKFKHDITLVSRALKINNIQYVEYHGDVKYDFRQFAIDQFQKNPKIRVFLGQPQAGGEGLNLSSANTIIWYSHVFNAIERNQASARATVVGGHNITLIDICGIKTLDDYILSTLQKKKTVAEALIDSDKLREMI